MDNPKFVGAWFGTSLATLIFGSLFLVYLSTERVTPIRTSSYQLYQALPDNKNQISDAITSQDARGKIIENFFKGYNSTLSKYSSQFVSVADQYKLDWRLLPSIAMQESNGGKIIPNDSFNPFGFGIYGGSVIRFASWEEGIDRVGKSLRSDYLNKGLSNPDQIMAKYTPPALEKGGSWAKGVTSFMSELE